MSDIRSAPRKLWLFLNVINSLVPKNDNKIFIYSNMGFRDNVRAVYDYLISCGYNEKYRIVCSLNDYKKQTACKNVRFMGNLRGLFSFFTCKYAFYCFGKYPVKPRGKQVVFNLWHGMPLKRIGNMIAGCENTDYNYFSYVLCTSEFFRETMKKSFKCGDEQIVICGEPRTDEMLRISKAPQRLLLWLPTFREGSGELDVITPAELEQLDMLCGKHGWKIIIKLHPLSAVEPDGFKKYRNMEILSQQQLESTGDSLYTLMGRSGALITDYSSVFFDYILLDRPIGFAAGDIEAYRNDRGFNFDNPMEYMPGEILTDGGDILKFAEAVFTGQDLHKAERNKLNETFNRYKDAENCARVLEAAGIRKEK